MRCSLYNCGKVCLSLLGTWSGGQGESWDPVASSALQVGLPSLPSPLVSKWQAEGSSSSRQLGPVTGLTQVQW